MTSALASAQDEAIASFKTVDSLEARVQGCVTCHGRVDLMPLMWKAEPLQMEWCLACHRRPERFVRPREHVFDMDWTPPVAQEQIGPELVRKYNIRTEQLTDCSICHR